MHIQESGEMYLETLYILSTKGEAVRSIDIAEHMNFSKPSVSRAISLLKAAGYVIVGEDGFLRLTDSGKKIAAKTYERHTLLTELFVGLGVSEETAVHDACKIEHDLSDETFEAIKRHINRPDIQNSHKAP